MMKAPSMIQTLFFIFCQVYCTNARASETPSTQTKTEASQKLDDGADTPVQLTPPISSENLWDEVMSSNEDSRIYDWRRARFELEVGLIDVDERTVFRSSGFHIGLGIPMSNGVSVRTGLRRIIVKGSRAGDLIERTPYRQPAQPNRYEIYGLIGYSLAEGRAFTRLSPLIGDCEHALSVEVGGHYTHPSPKSLPQRDPVFSRVNGQLAVSSTWVAHLGAKYVLYVPTGLGFFISPAYEVPYSKLEGPLDHWYSISFGAIVSFSENLTVAPINPGKKSRE